MKTMKTRLFCLILTFLYLNFLILFTSCTQSIEVIEIIEATKDNSNETKSEIATATEEVTHNEVIGVWISYLELSTILTGKSQEQFRQSYAAMLDNCLTLGINTVYVHLRPFGDALYESDFFPWSRYVTGTAGTVPAFDPLKIMLEETHKREIEFHGWLNPMRIQSDSDISKVSEKYLIGQWYKEKSSKIVQHGNLWYLNPAYDEVVSLICNGVAEIVEKYDVDGIHIDDYFYPTVCESFDSSAFESSAYPDLSAFRKSKINDMVGLMYATTKVVNPDVLFGISPQGNIDINQNELYADVELWCREVGYTDYIIPQIYYGFDNSTVPFTECIKMWQELVSASENPSLKLFIGLAAYKIGKEDEWAGDGNREWLEENEILKRQIMQARELQDYGGIVFFSYNFLFCNQHTTQAHRDEIDAFKPIL